MRAILTIAIGIGVLLDLGCRAAPEEAPTEVDDLVHFFFNEMDLDEAELVGSGGQNLSDWYDTSDDVVDGWADGQLSDLTVAEIETLEELEWDPDPSMVVGVYVATELPCTMDQMMEITLEPDQLMYFPGNYDSYDREFDTDADCFIPGDCDQVDWHSDVQDTIAMWSMDYRLITRLKRFRYTDADDQDAEVILARNLMPAMADESISAAGFEQSYHIEAFYPVSAEATLHIYGLWNYSFIDGYPDDGDFWPNQYIDGLVEWDERFVELCNDVL